MAAGSYFPRNNRREPRLDPNGKAAHFAAALVRARVVELGSSRVCYMTIFEYEIEAEPDGRGTKLEGLVTISETTIDRRDNDLAVLLLHGAGGDLHGGHLDDTSDYLAWMGFPVVRVTMKSPAALYRMRAAHAAMAAAKELDEMKHVKKWILMGHSNGARVAIALASEMLDAWRLDNNEDQPLGVVLFSFPLHAPGKHDDLRDDELMSLELPTFIVRGTRDTFSRQDLFDSAMKTMRDAKKAHPIIVHDVIGGNHSLQVPKSSKDTTTELELDGVRTAVTNFCISLKNINARGRVLHQTPAGRGANGTTR